MSRERARAEEITEFNFLSDKDLTINKLSNLQDFIDNRYLEHANYLTPDIKTVAIFRKCIFHKQYLTLRPSPSPTTGHNLIHSWRIYHHPL